MIESSLPIKTLRILVVDDDPDIRANVTDLLEDQGHHVDDAADGASALTLIERQPYDMAILDFKMPDIDGAALFAQLRAVQPDLPALLVTAYAGTEGMQRATDAGVAQVLRKPVDMDEVFRFVTETIRNAS